MEVWMALLLSLGCLFAGIALLRLFRKTRQRGYLLCGITTLVLGALAAVYILLALILTSAIT